MLCTKRASLGLHDFCQDLQVQHPVANVSRTLDRIQRCSAIKNFRVWEVEEEEEGRNIKSEKWRERETHRD